MVKKFMSLALLCWLWGCGLGDQSRYTLKHDMGDIASGDPSDWVVATDEVYSLAVPGAKLLPADHPVVERVRWWLNWIDSGLRSHPTYRAQLAQVPVPDLVVSDNYRENAWSAGVSVCYPNIITVIDGSNGEVSESMDDCVQQAATSVDQVKKIFADLATKYPLPSGCELSQLGVTHETDGSFKVTMPASCVEPGDRSSRGLISVKTINWVTVDIELIQNVKESELVLILAHELAHFYRAHATRSVNYYYLMSDEPLKAQPEPITSSSELWPLTLELDKWRDAGKKFVELDQALKSVFPDYETTQTLDSKLKVAVATSFGIHKAELASQLEKIASFLTEHVPTDGTKMYFDYSLAALTKWTKEPTDPLEILPIAKKARLGWYTSEQEADDVAGEILAALGLDFSQVADFLLRDDLTKDNCASRRSSGWMTNGKIEVEPLHWYVDDHHTGCFRAFNFDQEKAAHQYQPPTGGKWKELADVPGWNSLNAALSWDQIQAKARTPAEAKAN